MKKNIHNTYGRLARVHHIQNSFTKLCKILWKIRNCKYKYENFHCPGSREIDYLTGWKKGIWYKISGRELVNMYKVMEKYITIDPEILFLRINSKGRI